MTASTIILIIALFVSHLAIFIGKENGEIKFNNEAIYILSCWMAYVPIVAALLLIAGGKKLIEKI